jgi:signal transduction histidine kinase
VFERFFRGPDSGGSVEGCGLGLSIAERVIRSHHGAIAFRSQNDRTVVEVRLPLAQPRQDDSMVISPPGIS